MGHHPRVDSSNPPKTAIHLKVHFHRGALTRELLSCRIYFLTLFQLLTITGVRVSTRDFFPHQILYPPRLSPLWRAWVLRKTDLETRVSGSCLNVLFFPLPKTIKSHSAEFLEVGSHCAQSARNIVWGTTEHNDRIPIPGILPSILHDVRRCSY